LLITLLENKTSFFFKKFFQKLKEYLLKFSRLENGLHEFDYHVSDSFFNHFEQSQVEKGEVKVKVVLEKTALVLTFNFELKGKLYIPCNRCLDLVELPIETEHQLFVKFGEVATDISDVDEIMVIEESATQLDLSQHIYEFISLSIPYRVTHSETAKTKCNPEMIKRLNSYLIKEEDKPTDPRWDALKSIVNN